MGHTTTLTARDGVTIGAYRAEPAGSPRGGVVVAQEIFGANAHIRSVADWYAAQGYLAIAPALFDRVEPGVELGYAPEDQKRGGGIRARTELDHTLLDMEAAIAMASEAGKVAVVGYCWGGSLAFLAACRLEGVAAAVGYYGGMIAQHLGPAVKAPTILHFGAQDTHIPLTDVARIQEAYPQMAVFTYDAGHGFNCDARASYDAASATLAAQRTLEFLHEKVG